MALFRKKPIVIEATVGELSNADDLCLRVQPLVRRLKSPSRMVLSLISEPDESVTVCESLQESRST